MCRTGWRGLLYAAMVVPVYLVQRLITFSSDKAHARALQRYIAMQAGLVCLSSFVAFICYDVVTLPTLVGATIVTLSAAGINFLVSRFWVFAERPIPSVT